MKNKPITKEEMDDMYPKPGSWREKEVIKDQKEEEKYKGKRDHEAQT